MDYYSTTLATITNNQDNEYILDIASSFGIDTNSDKIWVGYNDIDDEDTFTWISTKTNNDNEYYYSYYTNWNTDEPNGEDSENCTEVYSNGVWGDSTCKNSNYFACDYNFYTNNVLSNNNSNYWNNELCNNDSWSIIKGTWTFYEAGCTLYNTNSDAGNVIWFGSENGITFDNDYNLNSFILELSLTFPNDPNFDAGILFRAINVSSVNDGGSQYYFGIGADKVQISKFNDGYTLLHANTDIVATAHTLYTLKILANGTHYDFYVNDELIVENYALNDYKIGSFGIRTFHQPTIFHYLKITDAPNSNGCENIDGGGWTLVRHVSSDHSGWHPATDDCSGSDAYGTYDYDAQSSNTYSMQFNTMEYNQFLFAFGDCSSWLVTTKFEAIGEYYSYDNRCILNSSDSNLPYAAQWYNRGSNQGDPWISVQDHSDTVVYGENNDNNHSDGRITHNGANVWIRNQINDTRFCFDTARPTVSPTKQLSNDISQTLSTIENDKYIGVFFENTTNSGSEWNGYNFYQAKDYCMREFGSSLASIHSNGDISSISMFANTFIDNGNDTDAWIGLRGQVDHWLDGSNYNGNGSNNDNNFVINGCNDTSITDNQYCCSISVNSDSDMDYNGYFATFDNNCIEAKKVNFICNKATYWRPIFKISANNSNYGPNNTQSSTVKNAYTYWIDGEPDFDTYSKDIEYILSNSFTVNADRNYKSLTINDVEWQYFYQNNFFNKIKVSIYKNETEARYFVYNKTNDTFNWNSQTNLIDSSFVDTVLNYYDSSYEEYWGITINYGDDFSFVDGLVNWIASVTNDDTLSCTVESWMYILNVIIDDILVCTPPLAPSQGNMVPQIRYSTQRALNANNYAFFWE